MKKTAVFFLAICLLLCILPVCAADTAEDISITSGCNTLDGQIPFLGTQQLVKNGQAMLLYETGTDTLMYAYNADIQLSPASLVKILTALIAIEKGTMLDVVTVREEVLSTLASDAVATGLVADEVLTVKDLLYCMMVDSGNDAAVILADHVMGSQTDFVAEMNRYVAELGCTATNFTNVHGLHNENQYTTARDMARIFAKALQNKQFREVFGAVKYTVPATNKSEERALVTQNYLMLTGKNDYYDERVSGSRTAMANDRTRSIASVANVGDMELICIVMGSQSVYEKDGYSVKVYGGYDETTKLLDLGFNGHRAGQILHENQILLQMPVINGSSDVTIGTKDAVYAVIPDTTDGNTLVYRYGNDAPLTAPVEKGQHVSNLQIWCGNVCIAQTELYAMSSISAAGEVFDVNTSSGLKIDFLRIGLYIVGFVVSVGLIYLIVISLGKANKIAKAKRQSRRNRRNRRRSR